MLPAMFASAPRAGRLLRPFIALSLFAHGCGHCGGGAELREGPPPYRACLLGDSPKAREIELGDARLVVEGRRARYVRSAEGPLRIAAFRGADDELEELNRAASAVDEEGVDLLFVLGGLGRNASEAAAHLEALALTRRPLVLIPGGDDSLKAVDRALEGLPREDRDRVLDARRVHVLEAGGREWILLPGAPGGRYAYSSEACGYAPRDVSERSGAASEDALTLAWAIPDDALGLPEEGIFAFPPAGAAPPGAGRQLVGPIAGPPHLAGEAYRAPGPTLLSLGTEGLRALGTIAFRRDARVVRPLSP